MKKKFLTLQTKIMFAILFLVLSFVIILSFFYNSARVRERIISDKIIYTTTKAVESTVTDHFDQQKNLVKDYSCWDDMYNHVKSKNVDWLKTNTDSFLKTYKENYFAVCDTAGNYIYSQPQGKKLIHPDVIKKLRGNYGNFFILEDSIPVHVSWSVITVTADTARKQSGVGYLFVAKNWDKSFMLNLSNKTGLSIFLNGTSKNNSSSIYINHNLSDINGKTIADIHFQEENFIYHANKQEKLIFVISIIGMIITLLVFWLIIRRQVAKPISVILKALKSNNINILDSIRSENIDDEWDLLANLVEDNIQKTNQLKELIATKDNFFDLIAHDLRSPFNAINGFADMLVEEGDTLNIQEREKYLKYILQASRNANKLLDQLLEWARLQTGRWKPNFQPFKINKLLESIVSLHESIALQKKVHLILNLKDPVLEVNADENMIGTVIRNIISNAIKFTEPGGFVKIDSEKKEKEVIIVITDNGKGMSVETVFSLFKVGDVIVSPDTTGKKGTGLGLILSKDLIQKNGGKIWVESEIGKGSQFYFTIPLA